MSDIFLSYASLDANRVRPLVGALEGEGWSVFWDRRIPAGKTWRQVIGDALDGARCVVVIWSSTSVVSSWVHEEADEGRKRDILVPLRIDEVQPPIGFRSYQTADLTRWNGDPAVAEFKKLLDDVASVCPRPKGNTSGPEPISTPSASETATSPSDQRAADARPKPSKGVNRWLYAAAVLVLIGLFAGASSGLFSTDIFSVDTSTALRPARLAEYNEWLRGYLRGGGTLKQIDSNFERDDFYVATTSFKFRDGDLRDRKNIIVPPGTTVSYDDLQWSELYFMDGFSTTESSVAMYESAIPEFRDLAGPRIDQLLREAEEKESQRAVEAAMEAEREQLFARATRPAGMADYARWLHGYIANGGSVSDVSSRDFPTRKFYVVVADAPFEPSLMQSLTSKYIVEAGVNLDLSQTRSTLRRAELFFMDGYTCMCEDVVLYDNMKAEFGME